ncbi:hypothetical protein CRENBAI_002630 [Crenichthys baileyi]|uniref:Uncharacterized protein n=1 Tax=Crenichthys baileyi TaxID=28760 RepID=A0AAV9QVZ0_9TELE
MPTRDDLLVTRLNSVPARDDPLVARLNSVSALDDLLVAHLNSVPARDDLLDDLLACPFIVLVPASSCDSDHQLVIKDAGIARVPRRQHLCSKPRTSSTRVSIFLRGPQPARQCGFSVAEPKRFAVQLVAESNHLAMQLVVDLDFLFSAPEPKPQLQQPQQHNSSRSGHHCHDAPAPSTECLDNVSTPSAECLDDASTPYRFRAPFSDDGVQMDPPRVPVPQLRRGIFRLPRHSPELNRKIFQEFQRP